MVSGECDVPMNKPNNDLIETANEVEAFVRAASLLETQNTLRPDEYFGFA